MAIKITPGGAIKLGPAPKSRIVQPAGHLGVDKLAKANSEVIYKTKIVVAVDESSPLIKKFEGRRAGRKYALGKRSSNPHNISPYISITLQEAKNRILSALRSDNFAARTLHGISRETKLSEKDIKKLLARDNDLRSQVKVYQRPDKNGKLLLTTKDHFSKNASLKDKFVDIFASERKTLDDVVRSSK